MCIYLVCATSKKEKQMRQLNEIQDVGLVTLETLETLELETRLRLYQESCTLFFKVRIEVQCLQNFPVTSTTSMPSALHHY